MPLLIKRPLIWIDIADRSPDSIRGVKPATEIVDGPISIIIGFFHLDFLVMFDLRHDCNVTIASIIPAGDSADPVSYTHLVGRSLSNRV